MPTGRRGARRRRRRRSSSACRRSRRRTGGSNGPLAPAVSSTLFFILYERVKAPDPEYGKEVPQPLKRRRLLRGRACAYLRRKARAFALSATCPAASPRRLRESGKGYNKTAPLE